MSFYFNIKKNINFKSLSKKDLTLKNSLENLLSEKITIKFPNDLLIKWVKSLRNIARENNYNNNQFFIIGIGINLIKCPKITNKQVSFLQKYNNNKIKKKIFIKRLKATLKELFD